MVLREMMIEDLDAVIEIENSTFSTPWTKNGFFTYLTRNDALFLVAEDKNEIVGYIGILTVLDEGDITNVVVKKERRHEGIGAFLIESLIYLIESRGINTIHLEVRKSNDTAIRLYERKGFVQDGLRKNYYSDPVEDAILMTRNNDKKEVL